MDLSILLTYSAAAEPALEVLVQNIFPLKLFKLFGPKNFHPKLICAYFNLLNMFSV